MSTRVIEVRFVVQYAFTPAVRTPRGEQRQHEDEPAMVDIEAVADDSGRITKGQSIEDYLEAVLLEHHGGARSAADAEADEGDRRYHEDKENGR